MYFSTSISVLALATTVLGLAGEATWYNGNLGGGACSFSTYTLPAGIYGAALSDSNWDDSAHCGACISVTGPQGNQITAMIVDECVNCGLNHLDLFPDAFAVLSDPVVGVIHTNWEYIQCPITSPLQVHNKDGVTPNWFSTQVLNANKEVSKLEVSTDGGQTWIGTERQSYNFFEKSSGFLQEIVSVKVTSVDGEEVIVAPLQCASDVTVKADSNFVPMPAPVPTPVNTEPGPGTSILSGEIGPGSGPSTTPAVVSPAGSKTPAAVAVAPKATNTPAAAVKPAAAPAPTDTTMVLIDSVTPVPKPAAKPVSSAPPAADLSAVPSAFVDKAPVASASPADTSAAPEAADNSPPELTTTSCSTITTRTTIYVHASSVLPPQPKPTVETPMYLTASSASASASPDETTTIYACESSSGAAVAATSTTLALSISAVPQPATTSIMPYIGAASSIVPSSMSIFLSVFAVLGALFI